MRPRRSKILLAIALVVFGFLTLVAGRQVWKMRSFARLQASLPGALIVAEFDWPRWMPDACSEALFRQFESWWGPRYTRHGGYARMRWLTGGSVDSIILYPSQIRADAGEVLACISSLKSAYVSTRGGLSETDLATLCSGLRRLPRLEFAGFAEKGVTDAGIAPLAGHPRLNSVRLAGTSITGKCAATFRSLPRLTQLQILPFNSEDLTEQDRKELESTLGPGRLSIVE